MNHTPGPWQVMPRYRTNRQKEPTFDVMTAGNNPENWEMVCDRATEANARLIAASPDLLEALQCLEEDLQAVMPVELVKHFGASRNKARTAIAKAEDQP